MIPAVTKAEWLSTEIEKQEDRPNKRKRIA